MPRSAIVVVATCAASAGAHAALVPQHLDHQAGLGIAFILAATLLTGVVVTVTVRPADATVGHAATFVLATLIAAYALSVTTGIPWLADEREPIDLVGLVTKSVEALGLTCSIQLNPILGDRGSLTRKEARQ